MGLKTYDYIITLKPKTNYIAFNWMSHILLFLSVAVFTYFFVMVYFYGTGGNEISNWVQQVVYEEGKRKSTFGIILTIALIASWMYNAFNRQVFRIPLFIAFLLWIYLFGAYWIAILYALLAILEYQIKFKPQIAFDDEGVTLNSFPKKTYKWHQVNNVIIKDGIITVDLYNNKIIQKEIEDESDELDKEFNDFCRSHLLSV
jgi:magnesium-transporting ATPase (P-type)